MIRRLIALLIIFMCVVSMVGCADSIGHSQSYQTHRIVENISFGLEDIDTSHEIYDDVAMYFAQYGYELKSRETNAILVQKVCNYADSVEVSSPVQTEYEYGIFHYVKTTKSRLPSHTYLDQTFLDIITPHLTSLGYSNEDVSNINCTYTYATDYKSISTNSDEINTSGDMYLHTWNYTLGTASDVEIIINYTGFNTLIWYVALVALAVLTFLIPYLLYRKHTGDDYGTTQNNAQQ